MTFPLLLMSVPYPSVPHFVQVGCADSDQPLGKINRVGPAVAIIGCDTIRKLDR